MFYHIQVDARFTELPPTDWLRRIRDFIQDNAVTINPGQPNQETSSYRLSKCYHDLEPAKPCLVADEWLSQP